MYLGHVHWPFSCLLEDLQWSLPWIWDRHTLEPWQWSPLDKDTPDRQNIVDEVILPSFFIPRWPPVKYTLFLFLEMSHARLHCALHPNFIKWWHFDLLGDLQYLGMIYIFLNSFESSTLKKTKNDIPLNYIVPNGQNGGQNGFEFSTENDTLRDYIAPDIKTVKMEVTLISTFYA